MWIDWFPWKFILRRLAKSGGFIDPIQIMARFNAFAQPSRIKKPLELLRAGTIFHARGLINTSAIQHNLDWIWPFWVERQYNPKDEAFIPRSFSLSHINLTHRNWTAIGLPDCNEICIVDPRGLVTPFWDGWSLDAWIVTESGPKLFPSKLAAVDQYLEIAPCPAMVTSSCQDGMALVCKAQVIAGNGMPVCELSIQAHSERKAWLAISLRPYNPEGVSFVNTITLDPALSGWRVNRHQEVHFSPTATRHHFCYYHKGDVHAHLFEASGDPSVSCRVGMATAAALYPIGGADGAGTVRVQIPLITQAGKHRPAFRPVGWADTLGNWARLSIPDERMQSLYDLAVRTLVLHSPGTEVYPGPYTYKRFWFRDAAFILHALMCIGAFDRVQRIVDSYPARQTARGFFLSQQGEWDSNGQALWTLYRFCELTGKPPRPEWMSSIAKGGQWILRKRLARDEEVLHAGLLPPGYSAEHLGPSDYYFWDNFWSVAGLRAAAAMLGTDPRSVEPVESFGRAADHYLETILTCLTKVSLRTGRAGMPASPYRRMDSGAIGSLAAGYPLQILSPLDNRLLDTAAYLLHNCLVKGAFFLDIIHSGINPYLTLHLAQVLLRAGDLRSLDLIRATADLASPTGQWPEAVHPRTGGGCMGDGQHVWAAAEWVLMLRNCFVREENGRLIIGSGIFPSWLDQETTLCFGPAPTTFGCVEVVVRSHPPDVVVSWQGQWRDKTPAVEVALPGRGAVIAERGKSEVRLDAAGGP